LRSDKLSHQPRCDKADCEKFCRWWRFSPSSGDSQQDRVMQLIFKKFNTPGNYIAENTKRIEA